MPFFGNNALLGAAGAADEYAADEFVTTWMTTGATQRITLPLRSGYSYDMIVDWGDGSTDTITTWDAAERQHFFAFAGTHTVVCKGLCEAWYTANLQSVDKERFRTVEWWGKDVGFVALDQAFRGCTNAMYIADLPYYPVTNMLRFIQGCESLPLAPNCLALNWNTITTIDLFAYGCIGLTTIPALPLSSTSLAVVRLAFQLIGAGMGGTVVELWDNALFPNITSFANCFTGATGLTNYDDIPNNWKGV